MKTKQREGKAPRVREKPNSYGRQKKTNTQKSVSLSKENALWAQEQADKEGISFSSFVEDIIIKARNGMLLFLAGHLAYHYFTGTKEWLSEGLSQALANGTKILSYLGEIISTILS